MALKELRWPGRVVVSSGDVTTRGGKPNYNLVLSAGAPPIFQEVDLPQEVVDLIRGTPPDEGCHLSSFEE
jgi:hypothetical protein